MRPPPPARLAVALAALLTAALAACSQPAREAATAEAPPVAAQAAPAGRGTPVVVLPVEAEGMPLLPDELERLRGAVAAFLAARGYDPVPAARVEEARAAAGAGRLVEGGPACRRAPSAADALRARFRDLALARVLVGPACDPVGPERLCMMRPSLRVEVASAPAPLSGDRLELAAWEVMQDDAPLVDRWLAAVADLREAAPPTGGLGMLIPPLAVTGRLGIETRTVYVPGAPTRPSRRLASGEAPGGNAGESLGLAACGPSRSVDAFDAVLTLDEGGAVTGCVAAPDGRAAVDVAACACEAFGRVDYGPGPPGRRVVLHLANPPPREVPEADGEVPEALLLSISSADAFEVDTPLVLQQERLAACARGLATPHTVVASLAVDETGAVTAVDLPDAGGLPAEAARCVVDTLGQAAFSCPHGGRPTRVAARITLRRAGISRAPAPR